MVHSLVVVCSSVTFAPVKIDNSKAEAFEFLVKRPRDAVTMMQASREVLVVRMETGCCRCSYVSVLQDGYKATFSKFIVKAQKYLQMVRENHCCCVPHVCGSLSLVGRRWGIRTGCAGSGFSGPCLLIQLSAPDRGVRHYVGRAG
jgi:hypothetical protein